MSENHITPQNDSPITPIPLSQWIVAFLRAKQSEHKAPGTLTFYNDKLSHFARYANDPAIEQITPDLVRSWLITLSESGHNPGGVKAYYRSLNILLHWWERETDPPRDWHNPCRKVIPPKVDDTPLDPILTDHVARLANAADLRDKAIVLTLFDTGLRASELCHLSLADLDQLAGQLTVQKGKGGKSRLVFVGNKTRRAIRAYLRIRGSKPGPLFLNRSKRQLNYQGLRSMIRRLAAVAGLPFWPLHSFRRANTLQLLRAGLSEQHIQKLLGHSDRSQIKRYAKLTDDDLRLAHAAASPVDKL